MKKIKHLLLTLLIAISPQFLLAHGQDKPGPHGGAIQMPGAFHTEVLDKKDGSFAVYLLDMEFKNPSIKNGSVKAVVESKGKKIDLVCERKRDHFLCKGPKTINGSRLLLTAIREKAQGNEIVYDLPVSIESRGGDM